jgi:hypothetical protein
VAVVNPDRLRATRQLVASARVRLSPERAFALLAAAEELLKAVPRQGRLEL